MPSPSAKPLVFISYAHLDEPDPPEQPRWLSFVMGFLKPGEKGRKYEVWMDGLMPGAGQARSKGRHDQRLQRQREWRPAEPLLYSLRGYRYCDLLLSRGRASEAHDWATQTMDLADRSDRLLDVALNRLTLGRVHLALALAKRGSGPSPGAPAVDARVATDTGLDEAVEAQRSAGRNEHICGGLLVRAAFRRAVGDWDGAKRDLNEAKEMAEPGLMRLYWCDCALEGARLALARREAFAPLNGLVERSPPPPVLPDPDAAAALVEEAREQLDVARKLIAECGYHRRDEELAELDGVVAGARRFADLPPRV